MGTKRTQGLPAPLEELQRRFERRRRTHKARSRISEPLWAAAVKLAGRYGLHRTAKALRVDYYSLKKRIAPQVFHRQGPQPVKALPHVRGLDTQIDVHRQST